jgi:hypothetical protein
VNIKKNLKVTLVSLGNPKTGAGTKSIPILKNAVI